MIKEIESDMNTRRVIAEQTEGNLSMPYVAEAPHKWKEGHKLLCVVPATS